MVLTSLSLIASWNELALEQLPIAGKHFNAGHGGDCG
ncbi:MAG: hypothetical protein JWL86_6400, partial [Rhizobium sp.]|nr:hypothetical protein [Rhizobium sp.]